MKCTKMCWLFIITSFLIFLVIGAWIIKLYKVPPALNIHASFKVETGDTLSLQKFKGQYILLGYFQTWCGDCIEELQSIDALQTVVGKNKLKVILVSDESWQKIHRFKEKYCNTLDFYQSPETLHSLNIRVFPTTYLLNKEGEILMSRIGNFDWSSEEVVKQIK